MMDPTLHAAIETLHDPASWVHLSTIDHDGGPHVTPMMMGLTDSHLLFSLTGKQKVRNLERDPRASFLVESGERWADLKAVHLTGRAEVVDLDTELGARFRDEMDRKYASARTAGSDMPKATAEHYTTAIGGIVRFTPDARVLNWDNAKLMA